MSRDYLTSRMFQSLTVRDLLEARSRHHVRLATQFTNVVGTAVGFFRYRTEDDSNKSAEAADQRLHLRLNKESAAVIRKTHRERTIEASQVRPWSPPCILVFVDSWLTSEQFRSDPDKVIPSFLETDDARLVPTCVILAQKEEATANASSHLNFPSHLFGGGYVVASEVQGREHISSVACLVTDGDLTYALTNRHVTGTNPGRLISTYVNDKLVPVGKSCGLSVGKVPSSTVYSKWPGQEAYANIDAALILVDDVSNWTTQIYGVGQLDEPFRINFDAALETCIGLKVRAFGGSSGSLSGEIVGLFYRYKALGGYDFIADFLIGARPGNPDGMRTLPGDSGTLWVVDSLAGAESERPAGKRPASPEAKVVRNKDVRARPLSYQPVALQWGGQVTLGRDGKQKFNFALATSVESACRLLEVDVVRDWNLGHPEYWGEMGHYTIGLKACDLISSASPRLKDLLTKNSESIGFDDTILKDPNEYHKKKAGYKNVPLADVPDNVWRNPTKYGGRSGLPGQPEKNNDSNNHFADMDQPGAGKYKKKTLIELYRSDPDTLSIDTWSEFYQLLSDSGERTNPGALPFRIWQGFNEMVEYLKHGDVIGYLCVAGTMAHYIGDSCQPLHISRLHHGDPDKPTPAGKRVHEVYETVMLDNNAGEVLKGLAIRLKKPKAKAKPNMTTGEEAARGVVELMISTYERLDPQKIVDTYGTGHNEEQRAQLLWDNHKTETLDNMAACCTLLASIWESAWKVAQGETKIKAADIRPFDYDSELRPKYTPQTFYPSVELSLMKDLCY